MTNELRQMQEKQLKLMQELEELIAKCSNTPIRDYPEAPMNVNGTQLLETHGDLIDVSIEFATAFLDANEAHLLTPAEYREFGDQNIRAQKVSARANKALK